MTESLQINNRTEANENAEAVHKLKAENHLCLKQICNVLLSQHNDSMAPAPSLRW